MSHAGDEGHLPVMWERTSSEKPQGGEMCVRGWLQRSGPGRVDLMFPRPGAMTAPGTEWLEEAMAGSEEEVMLAFQTQTPR